MPKLKEILIITTVFTGISLYSKAQKLFEPKMTFQVELALPEAVGNKPFDAYMQGLGSAAVFGQYSFPFHLHVGAGIKYALFTINEFAVPTKVYGNLQSGTGFIKVGYDKFHSERFATDFGVKVGYTEHMIYSDVNKANGIYPLRFNSPTVETTLSLILTATERHAYRLVLGYGVHGFSFKPPMIGLTSNEGYDDKDLKKLTQYIIVGFGYTLYFNGAKSD